MSKSEKATVFMEEIACDDSHGYDQIDRNGPVNYDCSGLVITAWNKAGVPVKKNGATYTGNMYDALIKSGFSDVTKLVNLSTGKGLKRGDVLLQPFHHTAMYCGNNKMVQASINEKGTAKGGASGDQTGREIWVCTYANHPWTYVLRYIEKTVPLWRVAIDVILGKYGNGEARKNKLKDAGYDYAEVQREVNRIINGY